MSKAAKRFGLALRGSRVSRGYSQQRLAELAGLSDSAISAFERAERFPRGTTIDALVEALGAETDTLIEPLLTLRDRGEAGYDAGTRSADPRQKLDGLLRDQPDQVVRVVLALSRTLVAELSVSED